jgi:hypothetical protein
MSEDLISKEIVMCERYRINCTILEAMLKEHFDKVVFNARNDIAEQLSDFLVKHVEDPVRLFAFGEELSSRKRGGSIKPFTSNYNEYEDMINSFTKECALRFITGKNLANRVGNKDVK